MTQDVWWIWMAAGIGLAILELFAPGFIFVGFAAGAATVGGLLLAGLEMSAPWAFFAFAVISVVDWFLLRALLSTREGQTKRFDHDINED